MADRRILRTALGAGKWFPGNRQELETVVAGHINGAGVPPARGRIVGAISPHAGYLYSGAVAGHVYRAIRDNAATLGAPQTVVVLGFSHRGAFRGVALMDGSAFVTPMGAMPLDAEAAAFLAATDPRIAPDYRPHQGEHSLENQVPFVQAALPETALVMAMVGGPDAAIMDALATALTRLGERKRLLVIASSDMLHDPDYDKVRRTDQATLRRVSAMDDMGLLRSWDYTQQVFCGIGPVVTAMRFARQQGVTGGTVLQYRNSGDDYPESRGQWVVGYGAVAFAVPAEPDGQPGPDAGTAT